jgi:O-antigen/teichoic acid export membrane protein
VLFSAGATLLAGAVAVWSDGALNRIAIVMVGFAPTILTVALLQMTWQGLAAAGAYAASAWALTIGAAVGVVASYSLLPLLHVFAFAVAEVLLNFVTLYVGYRFLERTRVTSPGSSERS